MWKRLSSHPWLNDRVREAVRKKAAAHNTPIEEAETLRCSVVVLEEFKKYTATTRNKLTSLGSGSKRWWRLSSQLLHKQVKANNVPPLKKASGEWARTPIDKANLFAETWATKSALPPETQSSTASLHTLNALPETPDAPLRVRRRTLLRLLKNLDPSSGTGPDNLPALLLKTCADQLATPLVLLCRMVLDNGWPDT